MFKHSETERKQGKGRRSNKTGEERRKLRRRKNTKKSINKKKDKTDGGFSLYLHVFENKNANMKY